MIYHNISPHQDSKMQNWDRKVGRSWKTQGRVSLAVASSRCRGNELSPRQGKKSDQLEDLRKVQSIINKLETAGDCPWHDLDFQQAIDMPRPPMATTPEILSAKDTFQPNHQGHLAAQLWRFLMKFRMAPL